MNIIVFLDGNSLRFMILSQKISKPSPTFQLRSFLKNIKNFLCKQEIVNNCIIPSMHAEKQITDLSVKHSFTLYPSLSSYSQTEPQTEEQIHSLCVGWRKLFSSFAVVSCEFLVLAGNRFWFTYSCTQSTIQLWCCVSFCASGGKQFLVRTYLPYSCGVVIVFLVLAGNSFLCYVPTQCTIQLCRCVSFLVVAGNSSQNENTFLQKNLIGLLYYDPIANVCMYL